MNVSEVLEKLQKLTNARIVKADLARALNIDPAALRRKELSQIDFKPGEIKLIEEAFNVNLSVNNSNYASTTVSVNYYPDVIASCGNGTYEMSQECFKYQVPSNILPVSKDIKGYSMCHAKGNSMYPRIWDGDFVICEHKDDMKIENGEMYIFCYDDQIYLKRLSKNINQIVVESENPDFPTQYIEKDEMNNLHLIGHVICSGRMNGTYIDKRV